LVDDKRFSGHVHPVSDRTPITLVAVLVCACFAVTWFYLTLSSAFACGPELGSPPADGSARGRLCDARDGGALSLLWLLGVLLAPVLVITGAILGVVRRAWRPLAIYAVGGFVLLAFVTIPFLALPSR
jgi:hypothetical protein